jgi:DNA-binding HxlR family transcriptional regulator
MADGQPPKRSYGQYCGIARALDLVGERWTLLVIRELLLGPLRYNDLLQGLPGIGTNLLAKRLKDLEEAGILERQVLPRPANVTVYALSRRGQRLESIVVELGRFGGHFLPRDPDDSDISPRVAATGLKMTFRPGKAEGVNATYALDLNEQHYTVTVAERQLMVRQGEPTDADLAISTTARSFLQLLSGAVTPRSALASDQFQVRAPVAAGGDALHDTAAQLATFVDIFGWASLTRTT